MRHDRDVPFRVASIPERMIQMIVRIDRRHYRRLGERSGHFRFQRSARGLKMAFHQQHSFPSDDHATVGKALKPFFRICDGNVDPVGEQADARESAVDQRRGRGTLRAERGRRHRQ